MRVKGNVPCFQMHDILWLLKGDDTAKISSFAAVAKLSDKRKNLLHMTLAAGFYEGKRNRSDGDGYRLGITGQKPLLTDDEGLKGRGGAAKPVRARWRSWCYK